MQEEQHSTGTDIMDSFQDTQKEILAIESKKTATKLFTVAGLVFLSDLMGLVIADSVTVTFIIVISVIPTLIAVMGILARKEPLAAMTLTSLFIGAVWAYTAYRVGAESLFKGILIKCILVYLILAGFQHAIEANRIKKEIRL